MQPCLYLYICLYVCRSLFFDPSIHLHTRTHARARARTHTHTHTQGQQKGLPYRESKLTRLLQHSLGANSVTMMIATLSPEHEAADENISTLTFALSARQVCHPRTGRGFKLEL